MNLRTNIQALADLLNTNKDDSDYEDEATGIGKLTPGDIGPVKKEATDQIEKSNVKKNSKDIWDKEEVHEGSEFEGLYDSRPQPDYEILYKQAVTSEDIYLQMGNKTPTSASCEDMVVKIKLPSTKMADVQVDVKTKFLDCRSPKFKLGLHLPHPVDHKNSKAHWDGDKEELIMTLRLTRDLDFMNF